jgi:hypothetical protein
MKFTNYLQSISDVDTYPVVALIMFITVFAFVLLVTFGRSKESINNDKNIPLN